MTIADNLALLAATKELVRLKLRIDPSVPFDQYSDYVKWDGITSELGQSTTTAVSQKLLTDAVGDIANMIAEINTTLNNIEEHVMANTIAEINITLNNIKEIIRLMLGIDPSVPFEQYSDYIVGGGGSTVEWDGSIGTLPAEPSVNDILMSDAINGGTRTHMTVSRNGGAFITYRLNEYGYMGDDLMQAIIFAQAQDQWSSVAFVHLPQMVAAQTGAMSICGINADGTVNAPHDATLNVLDSDMYPISPSQPWHPPHTSRLERNWITFKPTPSVDPSLDMYYLLDGSDSKPWIIVESAAVIDLGTEGEVP